MRLGNFGRLLAGSVVALPAFALPLFAATAPDPTTTGAFNAKSGTYRFAAKVDKLVTRSTETEIWAKVWYPTGKPFNKAPIAILLHGNHGTCGRKDENFRIDDRTDYSTTGKCPNGYVVTPNHLGYDYVAKRLATNGFVVVSINVNRGINAMLDDPNEPNDRGLILRRGRMILRHLMLLGQWHENGNQPNSVGFNFKGKLDFKRVTLFGHSRGGDAVVAAYNIFNSSKAWRSRLPTGTKFVAIAPLAPTDFQLSRPIVKGAPLSVLLPMCDGDVTRLSGIGFYDRSVSRNQTDGPGKFKSVFAVWGTNHNGYNTQWQTDDNYTADMHTCPGQPKLFPHPLGLSAKQQKIGTYFLMAVARGNSQSARFNRLFNPAYTLPAALRKLTRFDRSFLAGSGAQAKRLLRFDGVCSQKFNVTTGVEGKCFMPSEHDTQVRIGQVRWKNTGQNSNFAVFTLNNGKAVNLGKFETLDMRVGPDCFLRNNSQPSFYGCTDLSPNEAGAGSQNVFIMLRDSDNNFSAQVRLSSFVDRRTAVAAYFPGIVPGDDNLVLAHALLSSARIPLSRFRKAGFRLGSVKQIYIALGNATSRGGLYFGDTWAVNLPRTTTRDDLDQTEVIPMQVAADTQDAVTSAGAEPPLPPATLRLIPASDAAPEDRSQALTATSDTTTQADPGHRIISARRGSLKVPADQTAADSNPEEPATRVVPAVELLLSTPEPITDTSSSGLYVTIGGRRVEARVFATGRESSKPSITKVVVPSEVIDAAPDGASIAVASPNHVWHFGPINKRTIR